MSRHVMTHDNNRRGDSKFQSSARLAICRSAQPVFAIDHDIQILLRPKFGEYAKIEAFAREHGIDFYPAGTAFPSSNGRTGYVVQARWWWRAIRIPILYGAMAALGTRWCAGCASIWATE